VLTILHRYLRRLIRWAGSPSDEEVRARRAAEREYRIAWAAGRLRAGPAVTGFRFSGITPEDARDWIECFRAAAKAGAPATHLDHHIAEIERISMCRTLQL